MAEPATGHGNDDFAGGWRKGIELVEAEGAARSR
jgi:hypothetical protein